MAWVCFVIAGLFEAGWAVGLKYTDGFTRLCPSLGTAVLGIVLFDESQDAVRLFCIALIVSGVVGLRLVSS